MPGTEPAALRARAVIEMTGELGLTDAAALGAALTAALAREPVVTVDLAPRRPVPLGEALPFWVMRWVV